MTRLFLYVFIIIILGLAFAALDAYNFNIIFDFGAKSWKFSALFGISILFLGLLVIYLFVSFLRQLFLAPRRLIANRKNAQKQQYETLLTDTIASYISDDKSRTDNLFAKLSAISDHKNSPSLNGLHKLVYPLIEAQTLKQAGKNHAALKRYEDLAGQKDENSAAIGLHMLYKAALQRGDIEAAHNYCRELFKANKTIGWVNNNLLGHYIATGNWQLAQDLWQEIEVASTKSMRSSMAFHNSKALFSIARAQELMSNNLKQAEEFAQRAYGLDSKNINIINIYSQILFKRDEARKAIKLCEAGWKEFAHPDLAETYIYGEKNLLAEARFDRAQKLAELQPENVYSYLALSKTALQWDRPSAAMDYVEKAIKAEPLARCYNLAKIIKEKLGKSYNLPELLYDYAWCADGMALLRWQAVAPLSKILGAVIWQKIAKTSLMQDFTTKLLESKGESND